MKSLAERYEIILACLVRSEKELKYLPELEEICKEIHPVPLPRTRLWEVTKMISGLLTNESYLMRRVYSPKMQRVIDELTGGGKIDLILIDHLHMAQYVSHVKIPKILDEHNIEFKIVEGYCRSLSPGSRKMFAWLEHRKLREHEIAMGKTADLIMTVTEEDKKTLLECDPSLTNTVVIPIGIDMETLPSPRIPKEGKQILWVGALDWPPYVDCLISFYREIYPLVKKSFLEVKFVVVGRRPPRMLRRIAQKDPSVVVTGYVEDIGPYMSESAVFVVPIKVASGMRAKILDAFAHGVPVVSTSIGCQGIDAEHGRDIFIADEPEQFANSVIRLLKDTDLRERIAKNARKLVEEKYSWNTIYKRLDPLLENLISKEREGSKTSR